MLQKKKASEIIEKELGHNITPILKSSPHDYMSQSLRLRSREMDMPNRMHDVSASMMLLGMDEKEQMFKEEELAQRRNSFEDLNNINKYSNRIIRNDILS
jgi:hypothetical protein